MLFINNKTCLFKWCNKLLNIWIDLKYNQNKNIVLINQEEYNEIIYMQKIGHNYFVCKNFDNSK